ncbi:uncharacterized protein LY79DRAFT_527850, partial [Colletotrichum navitas]
MCQLQPLFFLWSLFTLAVAASFSKVHHHLHLGRDFNDKYDAAYFIGQGQWACSPAALSALKPAIADAQRLAQAAIDVLEVAGSETSDTYENWFELLGNANPRTLTELLNEHFKPAMTHFLFPSKLAGIAFDNGEIIYKVLPQDRPPSLDSLVYACPPLTQTSGDICDPETNAATVSQFIQNADGSIQPTGPTILALCPKFFQSTTTIDQMVQAWKTELTIEPQSQGFILLHELQHMRKATSPSPKADDLSINSCAALPAADKIRNAQNYPLFALDALTFPERAKPQSQ